MVPPPSRILGDQHKGRGSWDHFPRSVNRGRGFQEGIPKPVAETVQVMPQEFKGIIGPGDFGD